MSKLVIVAAIVPLILSGCVINQVRVGKTYPEELLPMDQSALLHDFSAPVGDPQGGYFSRVVGIDDKRLSSSASIYSLRPGQHTLTIVKSGGTETHSIVLPRRGTLATWTETEWVPLKLTFEVEPGHQYCLVATLLNDLTRGPYVAEAAGFAVQDMTHARKSEYWRERYESFTKDGKPVKDVTQ
jgi:hypothetical protein